MRSIARHVGEIIDAFPTFDDGIVSELTALLSAYSRALEPWARRTAAKMLAEVNQKDIETWQRLSLAISQQLRHDILHTPIGAVMRQRLDEQVTLIQSLPTEAAQRVHALTLTGLEDSARASEVAREIARSGEVTRSRATLIARTEVSRTAEILMQTRAQAAGSEGYVWETSKDADVRPSHRAMQGRFVRWDAPPTLDGITAHAGCSPNCRCWTRVVLPDLEST